MVKFGYTILYVEDVEKSIVFYENAFGFSRKFITVRSRGSAIATEKELLLASISMGKIP